MKTLAILALVLASLASAGQDAKAPTEVTISFTSPARSGMPIWLSVHTPQPQYLRYPTSWVATEFGCVDIEVRRGETVIAPVELKVPSSSGPVCGALGMTEARLPLHLHYPKLEPGTYSVRYQRFYPNFRTREKNVLEQSDWTRLEVETATSTQVESWLRDLLAHGPDSPEQLLGDFLPSLLASRSERALGAVLDQIYSHNDNVAHFASHSLNLFDLDLVRRSLVRTIHGRGPSYAFAEALPPIGDKVANQLAVESARYMESSDPEKVAGAMHLAHMLSFFELGKPTRLKLSRAREASVQRVLEQRNERAAADLVQFLSQTKTPEAHEQIWRFVTAHLAEEQSLICITWVKDPSDLPRITALLTTYDEADPAGSRKSSVLYGMKGYGAAAQPYMRTILSNSRQTWVRTSAAQQLALLNDVAGWQFFRKIIDERPRYRDQMIRWLKDNFPEIKNADEAAIAAFLDRKISGN
jgi:hypothetical protein